MSKTKDKLIDSMWRPYREAYSLDEGPPCMRCFKSAASEMYDHRQKEIDELRLWFANRLWAVGNSAKNDEISYLVSGRQGGHRAWRELQEEAAKILETNAAATRVMVK